MIDSQKHDFMAVMNTAADLYDKTIKPSRVAVYWEALKHRELDDVKKAINLHIQDATRGRFFPLPADVSAQLPAERNLWLDANEAWAMCPKDEATSAAMFMEMGQALHIAEPLIQEGDMVAARMAFKAAYDRIVGDAKAEGRKPVWFPSLGEDKHGRREAQEKAVQMANLDRPKDDQLTLPAPYDDDCVSFEYLTAEAQKRPQMSEGSIQALRALKKMVGSE